MKLSLEQLFCVRGGFCLTCSIIHVFKRVITYFHVKHLMKHVFID